MKKKFLLNSLLLFVVSFFLFAFNAKAVLKSVTIHTNENLDVLAALERPGKTIKAVSSITEDVFDISGCSEGSNSCVIKLKNSGKGLWYKSAHVWLILDGDEDAKLDITIHNYYPALVSLGNFYKDWTNKEGWGPLTLSKASNSYALESTTRGKITLPKPASDDVATAANGLKIKFAGYIRVTEVDQETNEGTVTVYTLPVQTKGACAQGGINKDNVAGAFGEPVTDYTIDGTGPYVYVACYEYVNLVRMDLAGASIKEGASIEPWTWDKQTKTYTSTSEAKLPTEDQIDFKFGVALHKKLKGWINQANQVKSAGDTVTLNGDIWVPMWEYNTDELYIKDRDIRANTTDTISSSSSTVTSCSVDTTKYLKVEVKDGKCVMTAGADSTEGNVTKVTVKYSSGEEVVYDVVVRNNNSATEETTTFEAVIEVVESGDEDENVSPGSGDIFFKTCGNRNPTFSTGTLFHYGSSGTIPGTSMNLSVYTASGCGMTNQVGLCIDPSAPGPNGTYIRDDTWDFLMDDGRYKTIVEMISKDVSDCGVDTGWKQLKGECADKRSAAQVVFRLLSLYEKKAWNVGGHDHTIYSNAAKVFNPKNKSSINSALSVIFTGNTSSGDGKIVYDRAKELLEAFVSAEAGEPETEANYQITKQSEIEFVGDGYKLHYSGEITAPKGVEIKPGTYSKTNTGFGYSVDELVISPKKGKTYPYTATVTVSDPSSATLNVPDSAEEKQAAAVKVQLVNSDLQDIFVIKPASGAHLQRLLFFLKGEKELAIYLGPDLVTKPTPSGDTFCENFDSTSIETCEHDLQTWEPQRDPITGNPMNNPDASKCNVELYRKCCGLVDEGSYPYSFHRVCTNNCSYNTLGAVCDYEEYSDATKSESATLYEIKEGYKIDKIVDGKATYKKSIGECIINLGDYSKATSDAKKKPFFKVDGAGNALTLEAFENNSYCQVACSEDWDMTLGTFGSYMGAEAVRAGEFFQIDKADLFIRGDKHCYTTFLPSADSQYQKDMDNLSKDMNGNYDKFAESSHQYSDLVVGAGEGDKVGETDKFGDNGGKSVSTTSAKGGSTKGGLDGSQACKTWNKVTYYKRGTPTKDYCGHYGSSAYVKDGKCYVDETDYETPSGNSCPSGYTLSDDKTSCSKTTPTYKGTPKYDYHFTEDESSPLDYECTENTTRYQGCGSSECHGDEAYPSGNGKTDYFKDQAVKVQYYGDFHLSKQYSDKDGSGAGNYKDSQKNVKGYDNKGEKVTCTITSNPGSGKPDKVNCDAFHGVSFDKDMEASDDLVKKINKKTIGSEKVESGATMSGAGASTCVGKYYEDLKTKLKKAMDDARGNLSTAASSMQGKSTEMANCYNFVLYTSNFAGENVGQAEIKKLKEEGKWYSSIKALGQDTNPIEIQVQFNPIVTYTYDEKAYVELMKNEAKYGPQDEIVGNKLEMNMKKNSAVWTGVLEKDIKASEANKFFNRKDHSQNLGQSKEVTLRLKDGDTVSNARNYLMYSVKETHFYNSGNQIWGVDTEPGRNYGLDTEEVSAPSTGTVKIHLCKIGEKDQSQGSTSAYLPTQGTVDGWNTGECYDVEPTVYKDVNYIERIVRNSSFFKNRGDWYAKGNAISVHGDQLDGSKGAIDIYNKVHGSSIPTTGNDELERWHILGYKNVFPVSVTTPRNLYKYTYAFHNIGTYANGLEQGRLMGNANSVYTNSTRTCFYEVVEGLCRCCGDEATTHIVDNVGVDTNDTDDYDTSGMSARFVEKNPELGKIMSSDEKIRGSNMGSVGFYNTVTSLSNLSAVSDLGDGERTLAANWSDNAVFNYNGYNRYVTNKGDVALNAIQSVGDLVYSPTYSAEYAYRLTPDAISYIKRYNQSNSYGLISDKEHLNVYGKAKVDSDASDDAPSDSDKMAKMSNTISFEHYGSKFLEDLSKKYAKGDSADGTFKNLDLASKKEVCTFNEASEASDAATKLKQKMESGCRWVDFIENDGSAGKNYMDTYYNGAPDCNSPKLSADEKNSCLADYRVRSTFRLAFK